MDGRRSAFGRHWKRCASKAVCGLHDGLKSSEAHFRLCAYVVGQIKGGPSRGAHLWAARVGRAPGPLAPGSTLAAELLSAMLSHSLQQQVVDGREVIVAAALQGLMERTRKIND